MEWFNTILNSHIIIRKILEIIIIGIVTKTWRQDLMKFVCSVVKLRQYSMTPGIYYCPIENVWTIFLTVLLSIPVYCANYKADVILLLFYKTGSILLLNVHVCNTNSVEFCLQGYNPPFFIVYLFALLLLHLCLMVQHAYAYNEPLVI